MALDGVLFGLQRIAETVVCLYCSQLRPDGDEGLVCLKDYRLSTAPLGGNLGSHRDNDGGNIRPRQREGQFGPRRLSRLEFDSNELQKLDVIAIRNLIQAVNQNFRHPSK